MGLLDWLFGPSVGSKLPGYQRGHRDPARRLVHGFLGFYTGDDGDPFHTLDRDQNREHLEQGWSLSGPAELVALMDRYEQQGECTEAFDLVRVIKLARHGAGAGWISQEESWARCFRCAERLKARYARWEDVYADFQAGREGWYGGDPPAGEREKYAQRYALVRRQILARMPLNG